MATFPDGVDFSTFRSPLGVPDLDPDWVPISGARSVAEKVARRWVTVRGEMDDPDYGYPIQMYYNAGMLPVEVSALKAGLRNEALQVEGVEGCQVDVVPDSAGNVVVTGNLTLSDQSEWQMVFVLSASTVPRITLLGPEGT